MNNVLRKLRMLKKYHQGIERGCARAGKDDERRA